MKSLRRYLWTNADLKLASLAIALLLWAVLASEPLVEVGHQAPLHLRNIPAALELSSETPNTVEVRLRGVRGALQGLSASDLAVSVDLSGFHAPGERSFTLVPGEMSLPPGVQVVRIVPAQVSVKLEERSERAVPVKLRLAGDFASGHRIAHYELAPPTVTVVGPKSRVALLEEALTDPVDLTGVIALAQFQTSVYLPDPLLRLQGQQQVRVTVQMERR